MVFAGQRKRAGARLCERAVAADGPGVGRVASLVDDEAAASTDGDGGIARHAAVGDQAERVGGAPCEGAIDLDIAVAVVVSGGAAGLDGDVGGAESGLYRGGVDRGGAGVRGE